MVYFFRGLTNQRCKLQKNSERVINMIFKFRKYISWHNNSQENYLMVYSDNPLDKKYFSFDDHPSTIMQSTGLFDQKEREIYESDIVDINNKIYGVKWDTGNAQFSLIRKGELHRNIKELVNTCFVVGNSYENIELLEKL